MLRKLPPNMQMLIIGFGIPVLCFLSVVLTQDVWNNGILAAASGQQIGIHNAADLLVFVIVLALIVYILKESK